MKRVKHIAANHPCRQAAGVQSAEVLLISNSFTTKVSWTISVHNVIIRSTLTRAFLFFLNPTICALRPINICFKGSKHQRRWEAGTCTTGSLAGICVTVCKKKNKKQDATPRRWPDGFHVIVWNLVASYFRFRSFCATAAIPNTNRESPLCSLLKKNIHIRSIYTVCVHLLKWNKLNTTLGCV